MVKGGWYYCPICEKRLIKVPPDSIMCNMPVWCRSCKVEWFPSIYNGLEFGPDDPFPICASDK